MSLTTLAAALAAQTEGAPAFGLQLPALLPFALPPTIPSAPPSVRRHGVLRPLAGRPQRELRRRPRSVFSPAVPSPLLAVVAWLTSAAPGTVRLLSSAAQESRGSERKCTTHGIILEPQPDDDPNDPLNWPDWRRACALASLGWHCLLGGGQTPVLAAGFKDVAETFGVSIPRVALTTGESQLCSVWWPLRLGRVVLPPA